MRERIALSDVEWRLMQIVWENPPRTYRQICDAVCEANGWTRYVVSSYLKRMEAKGVLRVEDAKPVKLYYPLLDRQHAISAETEDVLGRVYNGNILLMVQSATRAREMTSEERSELEALLFAGRHDNE